jgi:Ca-activated chloride channel family protein
MITACGGGAAETTTTTSTAPAATTTAAQSSTTTTRTESAVTLDVPPEVEAGTEFEVAWTGPDNSGDYVTIVALGAAEGTYTNYFDTAVGPTGILVAPIEDGTYEIRYVDGASSATVASTELIVTPYEITLELPVEVEAGTEFEVSWTGPDGPGDYITIVDAGAAEGTYTSYFDTATGANGTLIAPIEAGEYEIRYVSGSESATMASSTITVTPSAVTLEAPTEVEAGADFEVTWTGPNGPQDYVTIVPAGSPEGTYLDWEYTSTGNPVTLTAPEEPGDYEIWYASDRVDGTFATIPIVVK